MNKKKARTLEDIFDKAKIKPDMTARFWRNHALVCSFIFAGMILSNIFSNPKNVPMCWATTGCMGLLALTFAVIYTRTKRRSL